MLDNKLAPDSYKRLVSDISMLYEGARKALVEAYWKTGQRIVQVEQKGDIKAVYGKELLPRLSQELTQKLGPGFSVESLRRMRLFYLHHPKSSPARKLSWAHHIELLQIHDEKKRVAFEKRVEQDGLDRDSLRTLVRYERVREQVEENLAAAPEKREPVDLLKVPRIGFFNTYQTRAAEDVSWPEKGVLLLDRGFRSYCPLTLRESRGLKTGDIVEWTGTKAVQTSRTVKDLYTYKAYLWKVIDGDTFWAVLDAGVRNVMREKLRLRGIDCAEIDTVEGKAAKKFVEDLLRNVPSLTVLSSQNASYDRFEADVFFTDKDRKVQYLNNLLLQAGYAVRVYP